MTEKSTGEVCINQLLTHLVHYSTKYLTFSPLCFVTFSHMQTANPEDSQEGCANNHTIISTYGKNRVGKNNLASSKTLSQRTQLDTELQFLSVYARSHNAILRLDSFIMLHS